MAERRYGDDEVREIFRLATTGSPGERALPVDPDGLTLEQLEQIGRETGIEPARVRDAAHSLTRGRSASVRRTFGLPIGVARVVELPRAPTDREWEQLVTVFRTTFGAQGRSTVSGSLRDWSNGGLQISVEPTASGHQLRLSTTNSLGQALNMLTILMSSMAVIMAGVLTAAGRVEKMLAVATMFGGFALAPFIANLVRLPRWARERERQMAAIAEETLTMLSDR